MVTLGYVAAAAIAVGAVAAGVLAVKSFSDMQRYVRIRRM
jgi:hypothetical protein